MFVWPLMAHLHWLCTALLELHANGLVHNHLDRV